MRTYRLIDLPTYETDGVLTAAEAQAHAPFEIKRVFFIYEVPSDAKRAGHSLRSCEQLIIAVSGSFDVVIDDGFLQSRERLAHRHQGLYVPASAWRELENFSPESICLVLASENYDGEAYYRSRSYADFKARARPA